MAKGGAFAIVGFASEIGRIFASSAGREPARFRSVANLITETDTVSDRERFKVQISSPDPGYESFPVSIMNRSTYEAVSFDPALGQPATISYSLNKAGSIRIRVVRRDLPELVLRTIQDWTDQDFGKYQTTWDGRDALGTLVENKKAMILFEAKDQGKGLQHGAHDPAICGDPHISLSLDQESGGAVRGGLKVRATLCGGKPGFGDASECHMRCYVDYAFFKKEKFKKGTKEFVTDIDTSSLPNGEHYLVVNIDDTHDHVGSAGVKLLVGN